MVSFHALLSFLHASPHPCYPSFFSLPPHRPLNVSLLTKPQNPQPALPIPGTKVLAARNYAKSLWGQTAKIETELPTGEGKSYFLKSAALDNLGRQMIEGEFESLRAIHQVSPTLVPYPHAWGKYETPLSSSGSDVYFLLEEFREIGHQPAVPPHAFTARMADLHRKSVSPTGKFGFHITTCHATVPQLTDVWEDSWAVLYRKQLAHVVELDRAKNGASWPEFHRLCDLVLDKVVPRLLEPLESDGRSIKPCLVQGDLWDENTATDKGTGEAFVFDPCSFYAHNEYELGNWRAPRHRLSAKAYVESYKEHFPPSEPVEEWDDRNRLYSLRYDLAAAVFHPQSSLRQAVKEDMAVLCEKFFPGEVKEIARG